MKDYDIKIKNANEVRIYGTDNDTIVVPSKVRFDTARGHADIDIKDVSDVQIGLPDKAEKIELNISSASLSVEGISFEKMEIDAKGDIKVAVDGLSGKLDINMIGGTCELLVPADFKFSTRCEGRDNSIECTGVAATEGASNIIELNGKNSTLRITAKN